MKGKQVIAFLMSAVLSVSSCIPLNGCMKISAFAAESEKLIVENENDEGFSGDVDSTSVEAALGAPEEVSEADSEMSSSEDESKMEIDMSEEESEDYTDEDTIGIHSGEESEQEPREESSEESEEESKEESGEIPYGVNEDYSSQVLEDPSEAEMFEETSEGRTGEIAEELSEEIPEDAYEETGEVPSEGVSKNGSETESEAASEEQAVPNPSSGEEDASGSSGQIVDEKITETEGDVSDRTSDELISETSGESSGEIFDEASLQQEAEDGSDGEIPAETGAESRVIDKQRSYISPDKIMYSGGELLPEIAVYAEGSEEDTPKLQEGLDYEVSYYNHTTERPDNINAGVIDVTVTGIGNCTGELKGSYEILPMDISLLQTSEPYADTLPEDSKSEDSGSEGSESGRETESGSEAGREVPEEIRYNDSHEGAYLIISMEKYGKTYASSSLTDSIPTVRVLEHTEWQMSAKYIIVRKGKIVKTKYVTNQCAWKSMDSSGKSLSIDRSGKVTASKSSSKTYNIIAAYSDYVDGEYTTFTAQLGFSVNKLKINGDVEAMCCLAFDYILTEKWDNIQDYLKTTTLEQYAEIKLKVGDRPYLRKGNLWMSATMNHFISSAAGSYTAQKCLTGDKYLRAILFTSKSAKYLVIGYAAGREDMYSDTSYPIIQEGISLYKKVAGSGNDVVVTGTGLGGKVAKYLSYTTGCRSVTFNAESSLDYVSSALKDENGNNVFADLCKYYNPDNLLSYNYTEEAYDDEKYCRENYYRVKRTTFNAARQAQMLAYNVDTEAVRIPRTTSTKQRQACQRMWARNFYLGDAVQDQPQMEPSETRNFASWVCFGGSNNDSLKITQDRTEGAMIASNLKVANILANIYPGTKYYGAAKMFFDAGMNIEKNEKLSKIAGDMALGSTDFLPGLAGDIGGSISEGFNIAQVISDIGELIYGGIYPENHIFVAGKGDDSLYGSPLSEWYFYTKGDGHDTIHDGRGGNADNIYLLDIDPASVSCIFDPEKDDLLQIMVNGEAAIDFYMEDGGVVLYYGSPFNKDKQTGSMFTRNDLLNLADMIDKGEVACMHQAACPVDMLVLDGNGNIVEELLDGAESSVEDERGFFEVANVDGEYVKTAILYDSSCKIALRATGDGSMQYAGIYCNEDGRVTQSCSIEDIHVSQGEMFYVGEDFSQKIMERKLSDGKDGRDVVYDTSLTLDEHEISLSYGEQKKLSAAFSTNSSIKDYFWITTDDSVVKVGDDGLVKAVGPGTASVAVMSLDGSYTYDACRVTVADQEISASNFTVSGLASSYAYTGNQVEISLDISYKGMPLSEGADYELEIPELVEAGKYALSIGGMGRFTGTKTLDYEIKAPAEAATAAAKVKQVVQACRDEGITDEWETALWLHDWLTGNADYDFTYTNYDEDGVLLKKFGVCQSYALAYSSLLTEAGIENQYLASPQMEHAWNMVKLDGEWCHVDCTWDDPGAGGAENHSYFGMSDALMAQDHQWDQETSPVSSAIQNYYPVRMGHPVVISEEEYISFLEEQAGNQSEEIECYYLGTDQDYSIWDGFVNWEERNCWKYGIGGYEMSSNNKRYIHLSLEYTDPWDEPAEFTGIAPCPLFVLHGPDGTYDLRDYMDNGIVLIFGRDTCANTSSLLARLDEKVEELREAGVEVIMNHVDAEKPDDFEEMKELYPHLAYTYGDSSIFYEMEDAINLEGTIYFPVVFFINRNAMITYSSTGYVRDIEAFINNALANATGNPLPNPRPVDPAYEGSVYCYDGDDDALSVMIRDAISRKASDVYVKDGTWEGDISDWSSKLLADKMRNTAKTCRTYLCDYSFYTLDEKDSPTVRLRVYDYGEHTEQIDPAVDPSCTEPGITEGSHCKYCGKIITEQKIVSARGHDLVYHEAVEPGCEQEGNIAHYQCTVCGKCYVDKEGEKAVEGEISLGYGHDLVCHKAVEPTCETDGTAEYYNCSKCGKNFLDVDGGSPVEGAPVIPAHHDLVYHEAVEPGCETDGNIAYYLCNKCGKYFADELGKQALTVEKTIPHGHDYQSCISNNDGTHDFVCSRDESHRMMENCIYTYTVLNEKTDSSPECGRYTCGTCGYSFIVYKRQDITTRTVTLSEDTFTYDMKRKCPQVTIDGLTEDRDYWVSYDNNWKAGQAAVNINGLGNYTGTLTVPFTILPASLSSAVIEINQQGYAGKPCTPSPDVYMKGFYVQDDGNGYDISIEEGIDYDVSYENNTEPGTAMIIITGKGNFTGTATVQFQIVDYGKAPEYALLTSRNEIVTTASQNGRAKVLVFYFTSEDNKDFIRNYFFEPLRGKTFPGVDFVFAKIPIGDDSLQDIQSSIGTVWPEDVPGVYAVCTSNLDAMRAMEAQTGILDEMYIYPSTFIVDGQNRILYARHGYAYNLASLVTDLVEDEDAPAEATLDKVYTGSSPQGYQTIGLCGNTAVWKYYSDGTLRIDGMGDLWDNTYTNADLGWYDKSVSEKDPRELSNHYIYANDIKKVVIGDQIKNIGGGMFTGCENLTEITFLGCAPDLSAPRDDWTQTGINTLKDLYQTYGLFPYDKKVNIYYPKDDASWTSDIRSFLQTLHAGKGEYRLISIDQDGNHTHTWGPWKVTKAATVQETGSKQRCCTECGQKQTRAIEKLPAIAIADASVTFPDTIVYTGKALTPAVTVTLNGNVLRKDTDFDIVYSNNTNPGKNTAFVRVTGKGDYTGEITKSFSIAKAAQKITVQTGASSVAIGKTTTVKVTGSKGNMTYASSSTAIATVSKKGVVTGKKVGTVKITVTSSATAAYNKVVKTVTIKIVPAATTKITASNLSKGIKITWAKVAGATGYTVYRNGKAAKAIASGSTVAYTDTAANTNGTKYTYKIVAKASTGTSTLSKSLTTYRITPPVVKTLKNTSAKKMTVTWGKNTKGTGYQIQYCTEKTFKSGNKSMSITIASTVSKAIGGLTKGKTYYVRIRTYKTVGSTKYFSAWSPVKSVKISK